MLSAARVRRSRDKRKPKHPENAFSAQVASGNSTHAICILGYWLAGHKKSKQILGRIPCYGMALYAFSGSFDSPSVALLPRSSLRMTEGKNFYRT